MTTRLRQRFEIVPLAELKPHPENPRRGDVASIARSISTHGFYGAVLAQRSTGRIIAGEHRWKAARDEGLDGVPTLWLDVDDDTARRIMLADNRTSDLAVWDDSALADLLQQLDGFDGTGFSDADLDELLAQASAPAGGEFPEVDESIETEHRCPKCGYEWSGSAKPRA